MSNINVYIKRDTLIVSDQPEADCTSPVYGSIDSVEAAARQQIKRIAACGRSLNLTDTWTDGAVFRYLTDYPHLERIELYCTKEDIDLDRFKDKYTHKLPALIIHDKNDNNYGNFHREPTCNAFSQPYGDIRIRFYFSTCDIDIVYDNGKTAEVIPFPGNDQAVWSADFASVVDRSLSLFADYAKTMFNTLGNVDDQLSYAMRVVKLYPNRPSFYKDMLIKNSQRAMILAISQNNAGNLQFILNLTQNITLGEISRLMEIAQARKATSCTALLLNYKNTHFTSIQIDEYETDQFFYDSDEMPLPEPLLRQSFSFLSQKDGTLGILGYHGPETSIVIPSFVGKKQVTTICSEAFKNCLNITKIVIPEGVTEISARAFLGCNNMSSISISKSVVTVGNNVFDGCKGLSDENGFIIGDDILYAYIGPETEVIVPDNIKEIYSRAFSGAKPSANAKITSVTLPKGLKKIGAYAFSGCERLTNIILPDSVYEIGDHAFSSCTSLKMIEIPSKVTELEPEVFSDCTMLETVILPQGLTKIRHGVFSGCKNLEDIAIPEGTIEIGDYVFKNCFKLKELNIPSSIELKNCDALFENCENLRSITLPVSCKEVGRNWFMGCSSLIAIDVPSNVTKIGYSAFYGCSRLKTIELPESIEKITANAFKNCAQLAFLPLPNGIANISENAFSFCSSLKEITLPDACLGISAGAFSGCYSLNSICIPSSCISISERAFSGCTGLMAAYIPATCKDIGQQTFERCNNLAIHTTKNSYAENYAKENGIPCVIE